MLASAFVNSTSFEIVGNNNGEKIDEDGNTKIGVKGKTWTRCKRCPQTIFASVSSASRELNGK